MLFLRQDLAVRVNSILHCPGADVLKVNKAVWTEQVRTMRNNLEDILRNGCHQKIGVVLCFCDLQRKLEENKTAGIHHPFFGGKTIAELCYLENERLTADIMRAVYKVQSQQEQNQRPDRNILMRLLAEHSEFLRRFSRKDCAQYVETMRIAPELSSVGLKLITSHARV